MKKQITQPEINLTQLVERGYAIYQQLNLLNEEFKQIKDRLKAEGLARPGEHVPLADSESDGDQWIVQASRCECRIIFPGPRLKSEFDPTLRGFATMKNLAGDHFRPRHPGFGNSSSAQTPRQSATQRRALLRLARPRTLAQGCQVAR